MKNSKKKSTTDKSNFATLSKTIAFFSIFKVALITFLLLFVVLANTLSPNPELLHNNLQWTILSLIITEYFGVLFTGAVIKKIIRLPLSSTFKITLFVDLAITTFLIHITGGAMSPYSVLYLIPVVSSAIIYSPKWSVFFTLLSLFLYFAISFLGWIEFIPHFIHQLVAPDSVSPPEFARRLSLNTSAFATIAALSIYLSNRLRIFESKIDVQSKKLSDFKYRLQDILNSIKETIIIFDFNGQIHNFNSAASSLFSDKIKKESNIKEILPQSSSFYQKNIKNKKIQLNLDDKKIPFEISIMDLYLSSSHKIGRILILHNREKLEKLEKEIARQEKLSALGRLSAGIAHEIRNPLTSISGSLELIKSSCSQTEDEINDLFDIVFGEINRLNSLITELLAFTQDKEYDRMNLDLVQFIKETIKLIKSDPEFKNRRIDYSGPENFNQSIDPDGFRQIMFNLIINALEADQASKIQIKLKESEKYFLLTVQDDGPGISPDKVDNIFEPFYTTKDKGTGLGLSTARKIIKKHKGKLSLESAPGNTIFKIKINKEKTPDSDSGKT
ncbi:MAG: ATP-binding protein [Deltaproteobacteria bacterium]|jgi:two-component system sensor histidine kinase PilS (NtrC family)|nr:ATP-binding protein [Deltaproteobacteria bacterium]